MFSGFQTLERSRSTIRPTGESERIRRISGGVFGSNPKVSPRSRRAKFSNDFRSSLLSLNFKVRAAPTHDLNKADRVPIFETVDVFGLINPISSYLDARKLPGDDIINFKAAIFFFPRPFGPQEGKESSFFKIAETVNDFPFRTRSRSKFGVFTQFRIPATMLPGPSGVTSIEGVINLFANSPTPMFERKDFDILMSTPRSSMITV